MEVRPEDVMFGMLVDSSGGDPFAKLLPFPRKEYKDLKAIDKIPIGNTDPNFMGEDIFLDMSVACRIAMIAQTRSGKTYLMQTIASYCYQSGYMIAVTNDNKNEWVYAKHKPSRTFQRKIHPSFDPRGLPIVPLMPKFLWMLKKWDREDFIPMQFDITQINQKDLITVMGFNNIFTKDQFVNALRLIWEKYRKGDTLGVNFDQFYRDVEDKDRFNQMTGHLHGKSTRLALLSRLIPLKSGHVFGSENFVDLKEMLLENKVPVLCIEGSDKIDIELLYTYLAILQRNIRIYKTENPTLRKRRILLINDETSFLAPEQGFPSSKFECRENNTRGAYYGIYQVFGIQDITTVDPTVISQCKYIFISAYTQGIDVRRVAKIMNLPENTRNYIQENIHKLKPQPNGQRGWFLIEKGMAGLPKIVYPYAPACGFATKTFT